jgi:hypothetical protein
MWSHGSFSFKDLLDIVNPLQHLPVVGSIYRYVTGDEPSVGTRIIGDGLYGGPIGLGASVASNALLTNADGKDLGERLLADVFGSHDSDATPTLGKPQLASANGQPAAEPAPMPEWMAAAGTPDGQPATPAAVNPQAARSMVGVSLPTKPASYVPPAGRSIAAASAPLPATIPPMSPMPAAAAMPAATNAVSAVPIMAAQAQAVPMNQLFRSAPAPAMTPEQSFANQTAAFQHQISQGRTSNGTVINNRPVPLELSSNLLPVMPSGGHLSLGPGVAAEAKPGQAAGQAQAGQPAPQGASTPAVANQAQAAVAKPDQTAIAQRMIDALNKYEVLKKQEEQQDSATKANPADAPAKVDLSL